MSPDIVRSGVRAAAEIGVQRSGRRMVTSVGAATLAAAVTALGHPVPPPVAPRAHAAGRIEAPRASLLATAAPTADVVEVPPPAPESPDEAAAAARVALLRACAPAVDPRTLVAVIAVESGGDPLAVNINGGPRVRPQTVEDGVAIAEAAIAAGYSVDLGLMQVNSRNLDLLGTTVARMFDPCANVRAGAALLTDAYATAARAYGEGQPALRAALSAYNTGDFARGFANGYVARYYRDGSGELRGAPAQLAEARSAADREPVSNAPALPDPYTASPTVYTRARWDTADRHTNSEPALSPVLATR